jgi:hypothetical protein
VVSQATIAAINGPRNPSRRAFDEIGIDQAQAEYFVASFPEHQLALGWAQKHIFNDLHMLFDPVWHRTDVPVPPRCLSIARLSYGPR